MTGTPGAAPPAADLCLELVHEHSPVLKELSTAGHHPSSCLCCFRPAARAAAARLTRAAPEPPGSACSPAGHQTCAWAGAVPEQIAFGKGLGRCLLAGAVPARGPSSSRCRWGVCTNAHCGGDTGGVSASRSQQAAQHSLRRAVGTVAGAVLVVVSAKRPSPAGAAPPPLGELLAPTGDGDTASPQGEAPPAGTSTLRSPWQGGGEPGAAAAHSCSRGTPAKSHLWCWYWWYWWCWWWRWGCRRGASAPGERCPGSPGPLRSAAPKPSSEPVPTASPSRAPPAPCACGSSEWGHGRGALRGAERGPQGSVSALCAECSCQRISGFIRTAEGGWRNPSWRVWRYDMPCVPRDFGSSVCCRGTAEEACGEVSF